MMSGQMYKMSVFRSKFHRLIIWNAQQTSICRTAISYQRNNIMVNACAKRALCSKVHSPLQKKQEWNSRSALAVELSGPTPCVYLQLKNLSVSSGTLGDSLKVSSSELFARKNKLDSRRMRSPSVSSLNLCNQISTNTSLSSSQMKTDRHQSRFLGPSFNHVNVITSRGISMFGLTEKSAWTRAIAEAEKIVGYPTSFIGLRCLLSDELSNVAMHVRKLVGTTHPLVKTAKNFVYDGKHNVQTRGLIVLLISKAAGPSPKDNSRQSMVRGIYPSQRTLAEIVEMIHTAFLVHKGVVNIQDLLPTDGPRNIMEFGNKMAVLSGDFLLASACGNLAQLRNTFVVDLVSQSISDLTEAAFMAFSEGNGGVSGANQLVPNLGIADWAKYVYLSSGSLIGKSCRAALELAGHGEEMQKCAFEFGKNIALAQQLNQELQPFTTFDGSLPSFSLTSAPVLLHLESRRNQDRVRNQTVVDIKKLHRDIQCGSAMKRSKELCKTYGESARVAISGFPKSDAKDTLEQMVNAVTL